MEGIRQVLLPMVAGILATKEELTTWVLKTGLAVLGEVFEQDAERVARTLEKLKERF